MTNMEEHDLFNACFDGCRTPADFARAAERFEAELRAIGWLTSEDSMTLRIGPKVAEIIRRVIAERQ